MMNTHVSQIDHLVYAAPNLQAGIDSVEKLLGVRATRGGSHPQWGTANALLSLGEGVYLEIIGPDPDQPEFSGERVFSIDTLVQPALVTWAAQASEIDQLSAMDLGQGESIGPAFAASRTQEDGRELQWRLTNPMLNLGDGLVPFFIDWGHSPHPSDTAAQGAALIALRLEHPEPERVKAMLQCLDLAVPVSRADSPAVIAVIQGRFGEVELR